MQATYENSVKTHELQCQFNLQNCVSRGCEVTIELCSKGLVLLKALRVNAYAATYALRTHPQFQILRRNSFTLVLTRAYAHQGFAYARSLLPPSS